jgi:hypothetical protein
MGNMPVILSPEKRIGVFFSGDGSHRTVRRKNQCLIGQIEDILTHTV